MSTIGKHKDWHKLLKKDRDWDFGFLLAMERKKLSNMAQWFKDHDYGVSESGVYVYRDLTLAVRLIDAFTEEDGFIEYVMPKEPMKFDENGKVTHRTLGEFKLKGYVNTRNADRFVPYVDKKTCERSTFLMLLRQEKAWHLYCKLREYRMRNWWD